MSLDDALRLILAQGDDRVEIRDSQYCMGFKIIDVTIRKGGRILLQDSQHDLLGADRVIRLQFLGDGPQRFTRLDGVVLARLTRSWLAHRRSG